MTQRAIAASGASVLHVCESCGTELRAALEGIGDPSLVFQNHRSRASFTLMILKKLPELEAHVRDGVVSMDPRRFALPFFVRTTVSGRLDAPLMTRS